MLALPLTGNYLNVRLTGVTCNRNALGARLTLTAGGREQHHVINGGSQFGCLPFEQHFGLGSGRTAERLEIWWPGGRRDTFEHLPINATVTITQGDAHHTVVKRGPDPL